jgi:hypothetical protein
MFLLRCRQADIVATVSSPVSHKIIAGVVVTHDKLSPMLLLLAIYYRHGVVVIGEKLITGIMELMKIHDKA